MLYIKKIKKFQETLKKKKKKKNPSGNLTLTLQSLNLNDMAVSARKIYNLIYFVKGNIPLLVAVEGSSFLQ